MLGNSCDGCPQKSLHQKEGEAIRLQDATPVGLLRQAHVVIPNSAMQERDDTSA